jgi:acyl-CoA synthetase (NDP forming)
MSTTRNPGMLSYEQSIKILSQYSIPIAKGDLATSPKEAARIADKLGYPVVLKVISPQISHKTEAKALRLGIKSESELVSCYNEVTRDAQQYNPKAVIEGVLVQEMLQDGVEVIIGVTRDSQFGPVLLFGLGGVFVEVLKDVSLRVPPITRTDAEEMIMETKGHRILEGFRNKPKSDVGAILDILLKVSKLAVEQRESVLEIDLNPINVQPEGMGAKVVDFRFVSS